MTSPYPQAVKEEPMTALEFAAFFDSVAHRTFVLLVHEYAEMYQRDGKAFANAFVKFASIRYACAWIVTTYKKSGVFTEYVNLGKDFTGWANEQPIDERYKRLLAEVMLIIYWIINKDSIEG